MNTNSSNMCCPTNLIVAQMLVCAHVCVCVWFLNIKSSVTFVNPILASYSMTSTHVFARIMHLVTRGDT